MTRMQHGAAHVPSTVGVVGWGRMGSAIGRWLLAADWRVLATDTSIDARLVIDADGAQMCERSVDIAPLVDVLLVVVASDDQVSQVLERDGVLSQMRPGAIVAICSSVSPETCRSMAQIGADHGVHVVDVALVGGEHAANTASLTLMCGGEPETLARCSSLFSTFATDVCLVGGTGAGQIAKMANNMLLWACMRASYEVLLFAREMGIEPSILRPILGAGSGANRAMADWAHHNPGRPGRGLERMVALARAHGLDLPLFVNLDDVMKRYETDLENLR